MKHLWHLAAHLVLSLMSLATAVTVEYGSGASTISTTVQTGYDVGGLVFGQGGGEVPTNPAFHTDEQSRVTVTANPGIALEGNSQIVRDIAFLGPGKDDTDVDADGFKTRAIWMAHPVDTSGLTQGRCTLERLSFSDFPVAMQFGRTNTSSWADTSEVRMIVAEDCGTVFHMKNRQSLLNTFFHIHPSRCDYVWDVEAGGDIFINTVSITSVGSSSHSTLVRTGDGTYVSHHTGHIVIENVKIDSQVEDRFTMIEMTDDASCEFIVNGGHHAAAGDGVDMDNPLFILYPNGSLEINGFRGLYAGCIRLDGDPGGNPVNIVINGGSCMADVDFDVRDLISDASTAKGVLTVRSLRQHRSGRQAFRGRYISQVGAW